MTPFAMSASGATRCISGGSRCRCVAGSGRRPPSAGYSTNLSRPWSPPSPGPSHHCPKPGRNYRSLVLSFPKSARRSRFTDRERPRNLLNASWPRPNRHAQPLHSGTARKGETKRRFAPIEFAAGTIGRDVAPARDQRIEFGNRTTSAGSPGIEIGRRKAEERNR